MELLKKLFINGFKQLANVGKPAAKKSHKLVLTIDGV
jgi:hypothetical protein